MGFSHDVKEEISHRKLNSKIETLIELTALAGFNANLAVSREGVRLRFFSENPAVIQRITFLIHDLYRTDLEIFSEQNDQLHQEPVYFTFLSEPYLAQFLETSGFDLLGQATDRPESVLSRLSNEKNARAYLRGAFLASGSIVAPEKSYHVEVLVNSPKEMPVFAHVAKVLGLSFKTTKRRETKIFYLKDSETISDFLFDIGATQAMLRFENAKAKKDLNNGINRQANAQMANLDRQVKTATAQLQAIEKIQEKMGLERLSPGLREMAMARLKNKTANLRELGEALHPKLSKSGVRHRLDKLCAIAWDLEEGEVGHQKGANEEKMPRPPKLSARQIEKKEGSPDEN